MSSDPYFQTLFAERIGGANYGKSNDIYKFEKIKRAKRQALADFSDRALLDFGIGENDAMADSRVQQLMAKEIFLPANRGYADNGCHEFKEAVARFMKRRFNVELDPVTEINHAIGSKPALAMLPACFINPGDVTLLTVPGYPVAGTHTKYYGGEVFPLPLREENNFYPDLSVIPEAILARAKLLVINYPNSPTGQVATFDFYHRVIEFAKQHKLVVVQDAAHIMLTHSISTHSVKPLSFLEVDGARDVGVEIHSLSKGWNMIGWRMAWVCGNAKLVRAFADVKDNSDSGQFLAIQKAAVAALDDDNIPTETAQKYRRRLQKLVDTLRELGFVCSMPGGTYFLYVKAPRSLSFTNGESVANGEPSKQGINFTNAEEVSQYLIREHSICTVPWDDAGAYLRFSVTYIAKNEPEEDALMNELISRLGALSFAW